MIRTTRPLACLLALLAALAVGRPAARADGPGDDDVARAQALYEQGQKLFDLYRFEGALRKFEAAFEAAPIPDLLFNIGQCHRNLGNYDEAIFSFRRFLKLKPNEPRRPQVESLIDELLAKRAEDRDRARDRKLVGAPTAATGDSRPFYTRWWFWTGVVAVAAGTTAVVLTRDGGGVPNTDLGNLDFGQ